LCKAIQAAFAPANVYRLTFSIFGFFAGGHVHQLGLVVDRLLLLLQELGLLGRGVDREGQPLPIFREGEFGGGRKRLAGDEPEAGCLATGKATLLVALDLVQDDVAVAFLRHELVSQPLAVSGQRGAADGIPGQDVGHLQRPGRARPLSRPY
jgi:hypothetical protein